MTINPKPFLDVDFSLTEDGSEIVVSIRTSDGHALEAQDVLDAFVAAHGEVYMSSPSKITPEDIEGDVSLN